MALSTDEKSTDEKNIATLIGDLDASLPFTELVLPNGRRVRVETLLLLGEASEEVMVEPTLQAGSRDFIAGTAEAIPLIEEKLTVGKRTVETGKVRLIKTVDEYQEQLNEPLAVRSFEVERVILNKTVEEVPEVRHEGETTVYSVVEEQLILTKRLVLKEEVRVTLRETERVDTQVVTLRREHLAVEREDLSGGRSSQRGS